MKNDNNYLLQTTCHNTLRELYSTKKIKESLSISVKIVHSAHQNHPQFLLHFLIHIDVLMLCRKFELIPNTVFLSYVHLISIQIIDCI